MRLKVFDADYSTDPLQVTLYARNSDGCYKLKDSDFNPYFYALASEEEFEDEISGSDFSHEGEKLEIKEVSKVKKEYRGSQVEAYRIETGVPADVPKLKNELWDLESVERCLEFDIPFYRRYLIDKGIRPGKTIEVEGNKEPSDNFEAEIDIEEISQAEGLDFDWSLLAFDIEVVDDRVVMISVMSEETQTLLTTKESEFDQSEHVEKESEMLERFLEIFEQTDPDIVVGYNTDEYDFTKLREAANRNGLTLSLGRNGERMKFNRRGRFKGARIKARMHLDLYPFVSHVLEPGLDSETLDLDSVASEMLGKEKEDLSWPEMKQAWKSGDIDEFARYAMKDAEITYELGKEIVPQILELSKITGLIPFDTCRLTYGQLTENYLMREAYERNKLIENRPSQSKRQKRNREQAYEGGFVYTPDPGLYEDIAVFDFRSLYPTVMVAHNISPDTLDVEGCEEEFRLEEMDYSFCQDSQGFFPELVEDLVSSRYEIKKQMAEAEGERLQSLDNQQQAQKILANSFYGYLGYSGARWYSRECAEATTYLGREYIREAIDLAEDRGFEVVYGDTDSVMLRKEDIESEISGFLDEVNEELPEFMELEFEGLFKRGFFTSKESGEGAKKKYALMNEDGGLKITGFEQVRRDWSPIAKETQKKVLEKVLENRVEDAVEEVKETVSQLKSGEIDVEKLKIYTTLTKAPEEYGSTAPHVEAVKKAEKRGESIEPETTIDYVITRSGKSISDKAELTKFAENYDADYYIENQVVPVAMRVLKVFGYTEEQLKGKGRQSGLNRF